MKKHYRFGLPYFMTRKLWVRAAKKEAGQIMAPATLVIRDTHQEWAVSDLWTIYATKVNNEPSTQSTPQSATEDSETSQPDEHGSGGGTSGAVAE